MREQTTVVQIETATEPKSKHHRVRLQWLSLCFSGLLLLACGYFIYQRIDTGQILVILLRLDQKWLIGAIAVYWLLFPLQAYRFRYVFRWLKPADSTINLPMSLILKVTCGSGFVSVAAPVGLVADVAKIGAFRAFGGLSTTFAARCTLFDRAVGAQWMALLGLISFPAQWALGVPIKLMTIQAVTSGVVIVGVVVLLILPKALRLFHHNLIARIAHLFTGYGLMLQPGRLVLQLGFAVAGSFIVWATLYFLLRAGGLSVELWLIACFVPFLQLINSVPFLYMGWGGREIAMAATLGTVSGLTLNQALAISAAWGVVLIIAGAVNGVFMLGGWRLHRHKHADRSKMTPS